jgi:hypothetical protein
MSAAASVMAANVAARRQEKASRPASQALVAAAMTARLTRCGARREGRA